MKNVTGAPCMIACRKNSEWPEVVPDEDAKCACDWELDRGNIIYVITVVRNHWTKKEFFRRCPR